MCMFSSSQPSWLGRVTGESRQKTHVSETRIFARVDGDTQWLVYQMRVGTSSDVAMILPIPVVPNSKEDVLSFIDLSDYAAFFEDLAWLFPMTDTPEAEPLGLGAPRGQAKKLVVHAVGSFEASYVPTRADFSRLDRRFRLPESVWNELPQYSDWGFAVFKLKKGREKRVHPMAFRFPTRDPGRIFFPTLHVHDGEVHPKANFDHALYFQPPVLWSGGTLSAASARAWIDTSRARGLVDGDSRVGRRLINDIRPNEDTWVDLGTGEGQASDPGSVGPGGPHGQ